MQSLLLSIALLGQYNDRGAMDPDNMIRDLQQNRRAQDLQVQRDNAAYYRQQSQQEEERKNAYIIAGAVVGGLILFGLIARSGKK